MGVTITTTTAATPFTGSVTPIDRSQWTGNLYVIVKASAADTYQLWESRDNGATWLMILSLVRANIVEVGPVFISRNPIDVLCWCYRTNESSQDRIYYREVVGLGGKLVPAGQTNGWDVEKLVSSVANGGVAGAVYQGMDLVNVVVGVGTWSIIVAGFTSGANVGVKFFSLYQTSGRPLLHTDVFPGNPQYMVAGSGRIAPNLDIEHVGDDKQSSTPNLWCSWTKNNVYIVKMAWNGHTWVPPASATTFATDSGGGFCASRWDGTRYLAGVVGGSQVTVFQRDRSNGTTTSIVTPVHPTGVITAASLSYNGSTDDVRVFAVGTSTAVLYYVDYIRATTTWGAWTIVTATAILGTPPVSWGVRRSTYGNVHYDVVTAHSGAPNSVVHTAETLQFAPLTATWDYTLSSVSASGQAADVAAGLTLDWIFNDVDPTDVQGSYALSRQIGAGTINYFRASDSTWQLTEQQNTTGTSAVTLASGWGADSDANHTYRVKVWDSVNLPSASYSDPIVIVPSAKDNPTITAPTAAQVLTTSTVTVTWTVATETQYRLKLLTNPGAIVIYDTGWISSSVLTKQPGLTLDDQAGYTAQLQTKNDEGLASNVVSVNFSINLVEAPFPTLALTAIPASGVIQAVITNPSVLGAQPTLVDQKLIRRPFLYDIINTNPFFETNITDWTGVSATVTRSTTQAHSGVGAARIVPAGAVANTYMESGFYTIDPTLRYAVEAAFRFDTALKFGLLRIDWYTSGNALISSSSVTVQPIATAWVFQSVDNGVPPATAVKCKIVVGVTGTPATTDAIYADEVKLRRWNAVTGVVAASALTGGATYNDFQAASGIEYEYRVVTNATNGAIGYSAWTR